MTIYKNISIDNIQEKKTNKEKRKENKYFWRCVLVLQIIQTIVNLLYFVYHVTLSQITTRNLVGAGSKRCVLGKKNETQRSKTKLAQIHLFVKVLKIKILTYGFMKSLDCKCYVFAPFSQTRQKDFRPGVNVDINDKQI